MALTDLSGVFDAPGPQGEIPTHQVKWVQMIMILILKYNWAKNR